MIRPMQTTDTPDVLALLNWMDDAPHREVFAPDARTAAELHLECEDSTCLVDADDEGNVLGYCAVSPFRDGVVIEGPISEGGHTAALLTRAVDHAEGLPVYAFCALDNAPVREALEVAGLTPMHTTDFFSAPLQRLTPAARAPDGHTISRQLPQAEYMALYRASEDGWAGRLDWTPDEYHAHFHRDDVRLIALMKEGRPVGFAELELNTEATRADLTYLAVHPAERGQGYGRTLLALAAAEADTHPALMTLRARAHDHARAARALYTRAGLTPCRSIVTYLKDSEEEA
ncbi:GNAT family N-acetyltransferase [Deinococcus oregonensis]|uniref:GNAT family N-acetyltransferase n=1 Tax=Deinococcus oregonensis TaxID=1805970 RepID=A0ABV6B3M6_9DEIO